MKTLSTLKTLPLVGLLAMGLALMPAVSMADKDRGHGEDKMYQKHDAGKSHHGDHRKSHYDSGYYRDHKHGGHKNVYVRGHKHHRGHVHKHGHRHPVHRHPVHRHTDYVVVHDHYDDYDPFRLMLGLHFDNIDIIYRDF
jgi:hypothetical protein